MQQEDSKKKITLALQGGGAHGAITWGVLDRLLQEKDIEIEGVSGASAGAMNAAVLLSGLAEGGNEAARKRLAAFWRDVSAAGDVYRHPMEKMFGSWGNLARHTVGRMLPPGMLNPLDKNPLRTVVEKYVDFDAIRAGNGPKLFVAAANVRDGTTKIFENGDFTDKKGLSILMASAAIPSLYKAVEIEGEHYWDGAYRSNPALFPLIDKCDSKDLMLVHLNPFRRDSVPRMAMEIFDRDNELHFNGSLQNELGTIMLTKQMAADGLLQGETRYTPLRLHAVNKDEDLAKHDASGKLDTNWRYLTKLYDQGWESADKWLKEHKEDLGVKSTFDPTSIIGSAISLRPGVLDALETGAPRAQKGFLPGDTALSTPAAAPGISPEKGLDREGTAVSEPGEAQGPHTRREMQRRADDGRREMQRGG